MSICPVCDKATAGSDRWRTCLPTGAYSSEACRRNVREPCFDQYSERCLSCLGRATNFTNEASPDACSSSDAADDEGEFDEGAAAGATYGPARSWTGQHLSEDPHHSPATEEVPDCETEVSGFGGAAGPSLVQRFWKLKPTHRRRSLSTSEEEQASSSEARRVQADP